MNRFAVLLIALICLALPLGAQDLPRPLSDTVSDFAGILTAEQSAQLTETLRAARGETGVQIVAVTVSQIPAGQRIEDHAKALFNAWGVGDKSRNDGILVLLSQDDRAVRVALGSGYDPVWDGAAQRAIDTAMLPALQDGRPFDALLAGANALTDRIARPFAAGQPAPPKPGRSLGNTLIPLAMIAAFALIVLRGITRKRGQATQRCASCGNMGLQRVAGPTPHFLCPACGWTWDDNRDRRPDRTRPGGGSGGGFGGGRSSGGGATGRW